jgi:pyruvate formate lyase activating enzyme
MDIRGFIETSLIDWDGKISSVIFLSGCNLRCSFCHNYPLVFGSETLKKFELEDIKKYLAEHKSWIDGVVISGGEPTIYKDLEGLIKEVKAMGFLVKLDTNGTNPAALRGLLDKKLLDYVAMDVKAPLNNKYEEVAGCPVNLANIRESIRAIMESGIDYEFRTTVVPGQLDVEDIAELAKAITGAKKFILQQFEPANARDEELRKLKPYSKEKMVELSEAAKAYVPNAVFRGV